MSSDVASTRAAASGDDRRSAAAPAEARPDVPATAPRTPRPDGPVSTPWYRPPYPHMAIRITSIVVGLTLWELVAKAMQPSMLLVAWEDIISRGVELARSGQLWLHVVESGKAFGLGLAGAAAIGITIGVVLGLSRFVRDGLEPWLYAFYSIPLVALAPIFIVAFGIGLAGHTAVVIAVAVFPIVVNTSAGIQSAEELYLDVARSFRASTGQIVRHILLPSAVPFMIAGMRLAITRALIGVFVGELFGARAGIGYMILLGQQRFDTAMLYVGVLVLAIAGITCTSLLHLVEKRLARWRPQQS